MPQVLPVILCGGSGTRLWPLSRSAFPKQFLVLTNDGLKQSLFQQAIQRIHLIGDPTINIGETLIVTNEDHRFLVLSQIEDLEKLSATLMLEPVSRNTAAALCLAAFEANESDDQTSPILVVAPADHVVQNNGAFVQALRNCVEVVRDDQTNQTIAILGITPKAPQTGYGYIKRAVTKGLHNESAVECFVEKPDITTAQSYLSDGSYLWNSGIFVLRASTWLAALKEFRFDIFNAVEAAWLSRKVDQSGRVAMIRPDNQLFQSIPSESIDYAVIEKCPGSKFHVKMVELNAGWNDLGAWNAVWEVSQQDDFGNVVVGDVIISNSKNLLVHANTKLVTVVGVDNLVIVETADAVLVANKNGSQDVKNIVSQLQNEKREEVALHRKVVRPWGWYDSIEEGECFKVKRIQVAPGSSLSLQMHHHRAEHWIVVKGTAQVTIGDKVFILTENQSTYIAQGQIHRLCNPGNDPLEIIEVQSGEYLGEDDIVRFADNYGRK